MVFTQLPYRTQITLDQAVLKYAVLIGPAPKKTEAVGVQRWEYLVTKYPHFLP